MRPSTRAWALVGRVGWLWGRRGFSHGGMVVVVVQEASWSTIDLAKVHICYVSNLASESDKKYVFSSRIHHVPIGHASYLSPSPS